ncbi:hypothetical protein DFJ74DRAFT_455758 [Hyaloraphidium curvatum]|nr:hypothetical protein DFJ74DRAFT_455758 [Hyaloraphidium curvatum]
MAYLIPRKYFEKPEAPRPKAPPVDWEQGGPRAGPVAPYKEATHDVIGIANGVRGAAEKMSGARFETYEVLGFREQAYGGGKNLFVKVKTSASGESAHLRIYSRAGRNLLTALRHPLPDGTALEPFGGPEERALPAAAEPPPPYDAAVAAEAAAEPASHVHVVTANDTVNGLAMLYGVSADAIRTYNNLHGQSLQERRTILVPPTATRFPAAPAQPQVSLLSQFMSRTGCTDRDEARSYLARCEGDAEAAAALYREELKAEEAAREEGKRTPAEEREVQQKKEKKKRFGIF